MTFLIPGIQYHFVITLATLDSRHTTTPASSGHRICQLVFFFYTDPFFHTCDNRQLQNIRWRSAKIKSGMGASPTACAMVATVWQRAQLPPYSSCRAMANVWTTLTSLNKPATLLQAYQGGGLVLVSCCAPRGALSSSLCLLFCPQ